MSVSTPIFTTPSETLSCASAPAAASAMRAMRDTRAMRSMRIPFCGSDSQEALQRLHAAFQLSPPHDVHDAAPLDEEVPIGERRDEPEVLLDEDDRVAALLQGANGAAERLDDHRREPLGDLVEEQEARPGPEDAREREHLLLAPGQPRARAAAPLLQVREHRVDLVHGHAARPDRRQDREVLLGGERREDAALLRAVADAEVDDPVR